MKLSAKFNLVLAGVLALGLGVIGYFSWRILQDNARHEVVERAGLMMEAALAMRSYTVGEIKPLLVPHMTDRFLPQTVPAYAATQAFEKLRETHAEYTYKEATLNPTNPRDRAADWESDIVQRFRNFPDTHEVIGTRATPTGRSLYLARPIRVTDGGCLTCHSVPAAAPETMLALYGDANGFGWNMNEVVGAQIVSVPMDVPEQRARRAFLTFMGTLVAAFVAILVVLNVLLRRIVIGPVTRMAITADEASKGRPDVTPFESSGNDEIAVLATSFNRMRRSLEKAIQMLRK